MAKAATTTVKKTKAPTTSKEAKTTVKKVTATTVPEKKVKATVAAKTTLTPAEKIRAAIFGAFETFQKLNEPAYEEIQSKLGFVIGSYDYDKNPVGLYEFGEIALPILKKIKEENAKKVTQKVITDLEKALKA
jgi:hypothetical protein